MSNPLPHKDLVALLQVENDNELIEYSCPETGLPVWPLIRVSVLRTIMSDWLYKSAPLSSMGKIRNYRRLAKSAALSAMHNITNNVVGQRDVLIQSTGLGNFVHEGITRDRLVGYFSEALPERTLVFQDRPKEHLGQRYSFEPVLYRMPRNIIHKIYSRLAVNATHKKLARLVIERVTRNASERLDYDFNSDQVQSLINSLATSISGLPFATDAYANWFSKQGFKLLLKEDACYGGNSVPLIYAAKLSHIPVAEYQHGAISKGHDGYNVADALLINTSFHKVLPDYLLTYGNWWSNQTNMPIKKIPIGNPHLTESTTGLAQSTKSRTKVLVLGDGIETDLYLELASRIYGFTQNQGVTVTFRPHPFERDKVSSMRLPRGVVLDTQPDIYPSLFESRVVISELSTGLFEAVGLSDMVLLWNTEKSRFAFPELPFKSFSTIDELEMLLKNTPLYSGESSSIPASELWEPNWKQNYLRFVEGVIGQ
jgi:hypothetical protein